MTDKPIPKPAPPPKPQPPKQPAPAQPTPPPPVRNTTPSNVLGGTTTLLPPLGRLGPAATGATLNLATVLRRLVPDIPANAKAADNRPDSDNSRERRVTEADLFREPTGWAVDHPERWLDRPLLDAAHHRRRQAMRTAAAQPGRAWVRARIAPRPGSTFAMDLGDNATAAELGVALHGTYGWPILPATGIKGLTAHTATDPDIGSTDPTLTRRVFGSLAPATIGSVAVFDALPDPRFPLSLNMVTITPHHQGFTSYTTPAPPADWDQPVPTFHLTVTGTFLLDLIGPASDLTLFTTWLRAGLDEYGLGAKTSSGHGYATLTPVSTEPR